MIQLLANAWHVTLELAPWLLLGASMAGLLHGLFPPGFVRRHLGGRYRVLKAVAFGVPLPLCSCGVIPAGIGLKADGASDGAAVGFITATPQTGVDSALVSAGLLGWPFALFKVLAALVIGLVTGSWVDRGQPAPSHVAPASAPTQRPSGSQMVAHGLDMLRMVWGWLVIGVLVSAALSTWLPADGLRGVGLTSPALAMLASLLISLPTYVCATASVPIAAALVAAGLPTGAALVFLMAGPATNVATIGAVGRAFGRRALGIYLLCVVVGSVGFGLLYEQLLPSPLSALGGAVEAHEHGAPLWRVLSAVGLLAMLAWFAYEDLRGAVLRWREEESMSHSQTPVRIGVKGMTCGGCSSRLERVLLKSERVTSATVSLEDEQAVVYGDVSFEQVAALVDGAGFEPVPPPTSAP